MPFDCGACFAKYILCFFNFLVFLAGSVVLGVGIWLAVDKSSLIALTNVVKDEQLQQFTQVSVIEQISYILIAAGAFMFLISFLGYCGAIRESQCLLTTYGICLIIILILEATAGGLAAAYRGKAEEHTKSFMKTSITKYYSPPWEANAVTLAWDALMRKLSCCGVDNYADLKESPAWAHSNMTVPPACCVPADGSYQTTSYHLKDPNCVYSPSEANSYYNSGCYKALINWFIQNSNMVIAVGITIGVIQLIGIVLAFCLCNSIDGYLK